MSDTLMSKVVVSSVSDEAGGASLVRRNDGALFFRDSSGELPFHELRAIAAEWRDTELTSNEPYLTVLQQEPIGADFVILESNGTGGAQVRTGRGTAWSLERINLILEQFSREKLPSNGSEG
jgi:hypothetical protein